MSEQTPEALQDLLTSAGWLLFKEHARKEWGPEGYGKKVAAQIATTTDPVALSVALQKLHHATEEINQLMRWPADQMAKLTPKVAEPLSMHRGGR